MEKYYFKTKEYDTHSWSLETCNVKNDGTCLGTMSCYGCEFNRGFGTGTGNWVKCTKIDQATGKSKLFPKVKWSIL